MEHMEERLVKVEQRAASNGHRLDRLEDLANALHRQGEVIAKMVTELTHTNEALTSLTQRVGSLEKRPGALWDKLIGGLVGAAATGLAAAILAGIIR